jgi:thioredoxin 1
MKRFFGSFIGFMVVLILAVGFFGCRNNRNDDTVSESNANVNILIANDMSSFNELINSSTPVLVDFYADWCAPCRMMAPILEQVAGNMSGQVKIVKVNVDKNQNAAVKYGVRSIPTLMLFQKGQVKWQGVGVIQADQIEQIVKSKVSS